MKFHNVGQSWRSGTKCDSDCKTDWLWVPSPLEAKRGNEFCPPIRNACNARFPLPTLLYAEYSVKSKKMKCREN